MQTKLPLWSGALATLALPAQASVFPDSIEITPVPGAKPHNIVFILTDDHRYDAMGFMGHPFIQTPHLDSIAAEGVHLENAFVTTSLCSPSRASILTGLYTHKHRVIDNQREEPEDIVYFAEYLQKAGYTTALMGKWHMGEESDHPRKGFNHWLSFEGQGHYYPPYEGYTLNLNGERLEQKGYITDELNQYAVEWLKQQKDSDQPFMLYLSHKAVHADFTPAERHKGMYDGKVTLPANHKPVDYGPNSPRWLRDQRNSWHGMDFPYHSEVDITTYYQNYAEAFASVDEGIGMIKQTLKEMGVYEDTLIIYMGDNGFMFGEHGLIDKRVAYEPSIRVPMLMQWPSQVEGAQVVSEVVANIDIAPTLFEAAGLEPPAHMDGQSFIPLAQGKEIQWRDYFLYVYYWEKNFPQSPTVFSLRGDRFKYTTYYGLWDTDELYDLKKDPRETNNLIADPDYADTIEEMKDALFALLAEAGGMEIPMNKPHGWDRNKRYRARGGDQAADFPAHMVLDKPERDNAH
ncbi:sulfatase family protein [Ferrimonas marina]|uniref:N-acetylglucosamine-6-sulfatase n=1 Tax=Ferrimonas marina TaxID=299255 RepID=A0A1M5YDF4_9GAMM|nr:sulfatase [Ferrimonas marina]SHI09533.1 N-acetylglucosamine-6-sulfatase [Ferrimonas marina]